MPGPKTPYRFEIEEQSRVLHAKLLQRDEMLEKATTPQERREIFSKMSFDAAPEHQDVARVVTFELDTTVGTIACRLYHPAPGTLSHCLVWFHGGGHYSGDLESHDALCRVIANQADCAVLNVAYRLAPDHTFPAAFEDAICAIEWVARHGETADLRPDKLLIGGSSAGGNLAAAAAIAVRDRPDVHIIHQTLVYPALDATLSSETFEVYAEGFSYTTAKRKLSRDWYCGDTPDLRDPRLSPLFVETCAGLPPALIITAELDPLRGDGERYAMRLLEAGVPVQHVRYAGTMHGFFSQSGVLQRGADAVAQVIASVRFAVTNYVEREPHRLRPSRDHNTPARKLSSGVKRT